MPRLLPQLEVGKPAHYRWLFGIIATMLVLNLVDAVLTLVWLGLGAATEANPLMDTLVQMGPLPFVLGKLAIVSAGSYILWRRRNRSAAVVGIVFLFLIYYFLIVYHLQAMNLNLIGRLVTYLQKI